MSPVAFHLRRAFLDHGTMMYEFKKKRDAYSKKALS